MANAYDERLTFVGLESVVKFVRNIDIGVLKSMGLKIIDTNGHAIVPIAHGDLSSDLQAKLADMETRLGIKVQINKDAYDESHPYKILVKDTVPNGHVYAIDPVFTQNEKTTLLDRIGKKVQINDDAPDMTHTFKVLAKDTTDSHVYLCDIPVTTQEIDSIREQIVKHGQEVAKLISDVGLMAGSVPNSVLEDVRANKAAVAQLKSLVGHTAMDTSDFMRLAPGNGDGNYQLIVQSPDGRFHATTDFDYQVLMSIMNREISQGDTIDWLMQRPMDLGVIVGTSSIDLSLAPTERFGKHPLIEGDTISLKYPKPASQSGGHYIQDFVWLDGSWQPKHI